MSTVSRDTYRTNESLGPERDETRHSVPGWNPDSTGLKTQLTKAWPTIVTVHDRTLWSQKRVREDRKPSTQLPRHRENSEVERRLSRSEITTRDGNPRPSCQRTKGRIPTVTVDENK